MTSSYDGKAKAFLDYEITASDIVTIDMITWVRDNFVMDSLIDGVPRGIMPLRLDNVNMTIESEEDVYWKLDVIENEIMRDHYEMDRLTDGGPTLEIDVAAPEIEVIKSRPVRDNNAVIVKKTTKYMYINEIIEAINF